MTTSRLSKVEFGAFESLWATENYVLMPRGTADDPAYGYDIVNRGTAQVEIRIDQEPQGLMAMLWLQDQYEEIMADPEREYFRRKPSSQGQALTRSRIVN